MRRSSWRTSLIINRQRTQRLGGGVAGPHAAQQFSGVIGALRFERNPMATNVFCPRRAFVTIE